MEKGEAEGDDSQEGGGEEATAEAAGTYGTVVHSANALALTKFLRESECTHSDNLTTSKIHEC